MTPEERAEIFAGACFLGNDRSLFISLLTDAFDVCGRAARAEGAAEEARAIADRAFARSNEFPGDVREALELRIFAYELRQRHAKPSGTVCSTCYKPFSECRCHAKPEPAKPGAAYAEMLADMRRVAREERMRYIGFYPPEIEAIKSIVREEIINDRLARAEFES